MKNKTFTLLIFIGLIFITSCDKLFTFDVSDQTNITIENFISIDLPIDIPTPDITTNSESEFAQNDTKVELVKEIIIKDLNLTITSPTNETFSFLKSIYIYISTNDTDEIELAKMENIVSDAKSIQLNVTNKVLDKYVKSKKYKIRTKAITKETLFHDVNITIDFTFQVTADLL